MSFITRVGNLAATPELRHDKNGRPYCFPRVIVNDAKLNEHGEYETTGTTAYNVAVNGNQAEQLCKTAQKDGNIRVLFTGHYHVETYTRDDGTTGTSHKVNATDIAASFKGQNITINPHKQTPDTKQPDTAPTAPVQQPTSDWALPTENPF